MPSVPGQLGPVARRGQAAAGQRRREAAVARLVAGLDRDQVGPRRDRPPAAREPVPVPDLGPVRQRVVLEHEPRGPGPRLEHADDGLAPRRLEVHVGGAAVGRWQQFGAERVARADRRDERARRRRVEAHRGRGHDAAPLVLQGDAVAVAPVGRARAVVGPPVPLQAHELARRHATAAHELAHLVAAAVEDRDAHVVCLLDLERHAGDVVAPVAVGREVGEHGEPREHGRGVLEPLRDEEGAEGGEHEDGEDARP